MRSKSDEMLTPVPRVGGRQQELPFPEEGGGYPDICRSPDFEKTRERRGPAQRDPRLDELCEIGLGARWTRVAETIGFEAFMEMWRILDEENQRAEVEEPARVRVPLYSRWLRYQRNKYIKAMAEEGRRPREIRQRIAVELCEQVSERHIARIISDAEVALE